MPWHHAGNQAARSTARLARRTRKNQFGVGEAGLAEALGSKSKTFQIVGLTQALETLWRPGWKSEDAKERERQAVYDALRNIAPRSELEGMLAIQMIATHNGSMECMRRTMLPEQTFEGRDQNVKHAVKLMALYERQLAALDKHRGKGQQKITVEHVTVEAGGQAIVGNVTTRGQTKPAGEEKAKALSNDSQADARVSDTLARAKPAKKAAIRKGER